jgi:hypothetical protein
MSQFIAANGWAVCSSFTIGKQLESKDPIFAPYGLRSGTRLSKLSFSGDNYEFATDTCSRFCWLLKGADDTHGNET